MKTYQLIHVCNELGVRFCRVTLKDLLIDDTIPPEEFEVTLDLAVGGKMLLHYGGHPIKTGTLIRKEDVNEYDF